MAQDEARREGRLAKVAPRLYALTVEDVTYRPTNAVTALGALWFALQPVHITADAPTSLKDRYSAQGFLDRAQFFRDSLEALVNPQLTAGAPDMCLIDLPVYASLALRLCPSEAQAASVAALFEQRTHPLRAGGSSPSDLETPL